jgi:hypothetical protein
MKGRPASREFPRWPLRLLWLAPAIMLGIVMCGCGKSQEDAALDSDANGFLCLNCRAKFYTSRKIFANHCPACQKPDVELVVGFVCPTDGHVTYAPRGRGALTCEQCRKLTGSLSIPKEKELKAWGATRKTGPEVGVN